MFPKLARFWAATFSHTDRRLATRREKRRRDALTNDVRLARDIGLLRDRSDEAFR